MCVKLIDTNIASLHIVPIMPNMFEKLNPYWAIHIQMYTMLESLWGLGLVADPEDTALQWSEMR